MICLLQTHDVPLSTCRFVGCCSRPIIGLSEALEQRRASAAALSSPSFTSKSGTAYDASDDTIRLPLEPRKPDIKKHAGSFSYSRPVSCLRSWTEACPARYSCAASGWGSLLELNDRNSKQLLRQDIQVV